MKIVHSLCFLLVSVSMSGVAATKDKDVKKCKGSQCDATVTVNSCTDIAVNPDPIYVAKGNKPKMIWKLVTAGWTFTENGIDIKDHGDEFDGKLKESGTTFKWNNKHKKSRPTEPFKYDINVTDGKQTCKKDPQIVNE